MDYNHSSKETTMKIVPCISLQFGSQNHSAYCLFPFLFYTQHTTREQNKMPLRLQEPQISYDNMHIKMSLYIYYFTYKKTK